MTTGIDQNKVLFASLISGVYFTLLFLSSHYHPDIVIIGVLKEMFTIPMILLQVAIVAFAVYWVFVKKQKISIQILTAFLISVALITLMFVL